jgi:hypothetical protein
MANKQGNKKGVVAQKHERVQRLILEQLRQIPVVQYACVRVGIGRATLYRMLEDDPDFRESVNKAIAEGNAFISDLSIGGIIQLIKDGNFAPMKYWLEVHDPKYSRKLQLSGKVEVEIESKELTDAEKEIIDKALREFFGENKEGDDTEKGDEASDNDDHGQ